MFTASDLLAATCGSMLNPVTIVVSLPLAWALRRGWVCLAVAAGYGYAMYWASAPGPYGQDALLGWGHAAGSFLDAMLYIGVRTRLVPWMKAGKVSPPEGG